MGKLVAAPVGDKWSKPQVFEEQEINLVTNNVAGGINTYLDPADISDSQVRAATNYRIVGDVCFPRYGSSRDPFEPQGAFPSAKPILQITRFARFDGSSIYTIFNDEKIFRRTNIAWVEITGAGFTVSQRQKTLASNDRFFFATGKDYIQEIDFATNTYARLGNAPKYKYICGFFNRIVGANLYDSTTPPNNPVQVGWSGDLNYGEWNALTDISAGNSALVEGQGDYSDEITGLFGFASVMLIARQRSLWIATKQPVASMPFQFTAAYPNVGCDSPDSIAQTKNGITWYDFRSNQVYTYEIGSSPQPIGFPIRKDLKRLIQDNLVLQGAYDPVGNRYHLTIPANSISIQASIFIFDFETGSWVSDTRNFCNGVFPLDEISTDLVINDLQGTINSLVGVINDLNAISISPSTINYGLNDGVILQDDPTLYDDDNGNVTAVLESKVFQVPPKDISVSQLLLKIVPVLAPGFMDVYFSRNGGETYELYKTVHWLSEDLGVRKNFTFNKHITTDEFSWKLISPVGRFELNEYRIQAVSTTEVRPR